jgi:hypothetical protein
MISRSANSLHRYSLNYASLSQSGYMRLQDFGAFERVYEDPKHVDTHGKTHHDNHDDIHVDDASGRPHDDVGSWGNSHTHRVAKKTDKHADLDSFDYSFLILTTC